MSPITSHVLDTALGKPAADLALRLDVQRPDGSWQLLSERRTNRDGRVTDLLAGAALERARYRLTFDTGAYFASTGQPVFYPVVEIVFEIRVESDHYHIPLLLSPYGYSTYRGS
jgi:5-hydroxyisourate hydrolase